MFTSRLHAACAITLFLISPAFAQNTTEEPERLTCTYPVSGQYGLLPRVLYYVSFVVAVVARRHEWLAGAALGSVMIFSSTAVLHLMIIHRTQYAFPRVLDLDYFPIKVIISTAVSFSMIVYFSDTVSRSRARPIIISWIAWVLIGAILVFLNTPKLSSSTPDRGLLELFCLTPNNSSSTGTTLLVSLDQLSTPGLSFNCTYECFSSRSPIRSSEEIIAIIRRAPPQISRWSFLVLVSVWGFATGAYHSDKFRTWLHLPPRLPKLLPRLKMRACGMKYLSPQYFLPLGGVVLIAISERYLLRGLPEGEEMHAVGQWAPIVGAMFVLVAVLFDKYLADSGWELMVRINARAKVLYFRIRGKRDQGARLLGGANSVELGMGSQQDVDVEAMGEEVGSG